jgi:hypothetical protein
MGILHRRPGNRGQASPGQTSPGHFCTTEGFYTSGSSTSRGGVEESDRLAKVGPTDSSWVGSQGLPRRRNAWVDNVLLGWAEILT